MHKGFFSGFQPYFGAVEDDPPSFVLRRKSHTGSEKMRLFF